MQSFIQHRRFKAQVQAQQDRYKESCTKIDREVPTSTSSNEHVDEKEHDDLNDGPIRESPERVQEREAAAERVGDGHYDVERMYTHTDQEMPPRMMRTISDGLRLGYAMTGVDVKTTTNTEEHVFIVGFEGPKDPENPHNWSMARRIMITLIIASIGFIVGWSSAITSGALPQAAKDFHVSDVVEALATGVFLVGFGIGALISGPFSEFLGRNPVYIVTMIGYMIFVMASALSPNIAAQLVFRTLAGLFAATPLVCAGGSISDLWSPVEQTFAFPLFANGGFIGPMLAPMVGAYIGASSQVSWRWVEWPETYAPILLSWKAQEVRKVTGDNRFRSELETRHKSFPQTMKTSLSRPFIILFTEPIVMLIALYLMVVYIIMFTFLNSFSFIYTEVHGFSQGKTGLCFLGIVAGLCLCSLFCPFTYKRYKRKTEQLKKQMEARGELGPTRVPPEERLILAMIGAPTLPISLFWMAWTAYPSISPWSCIIASVFTGFGILSIFISSYQYVIDVYKLRAASALASVTVLRYTVAGGMVVVAIPMYKNLGVHWALTLLGCLSTVLTVVPYAFYIWGPRIRALSKYTAEK